ncbi:MAG: regulatory signaling modulator protein AmpE [Proteobacteria bacterium]|nr:regulatory signaling modulator protein AmpE [Pseudomonadota bacterium]TDJ38533.1 MAG: regulatory signaling modulator protein AmpE [Gammaproteobacteria bacterium]
MTLLALLIGLVVERLATRLFHLRRLRWLDRLIDLGFHQIERFANWPSLIPVILLALVLILPVFLVLFSLRDALYGVANLVLAIFVLFFSLGPKDIGEDVDEYCRAIEADDEERILHTSKALIETDVLTDPLKRIQKVEESICIQANNRLFAVIFWFVLLGPYGPLGAWGYRVTDLIRRRTVFNSSRDDANSNAAVLQAAETLHGWLAWVPARLTAIGYAMAGSFEGALSAWRTPGESKAMPSHEQSDTLLARVGIGAMSLQDIEGESISDRGVRGARAANGLVFRLLFIWAAVIAAMTLYGWSV